MIVSALRQRILYRSLKDTAARPTAARRVVSAESDRFFGGVHRSAPTRSWDRCRHLHQSVAFGTRNFGSATTPTTTASVVTKTSDADANSDEKDPLKGMFSSPISLPRIWRYFELENFTEKEIDGVFDRIHRIDGATITREQLKDFMIERIKAMEGESEEFAPQTPESEFLRQRFADAESDRIWKALFDSQKSVDKSHFSQVIREKASRVDFVRTLPIVSSMLIVGASVGVVTPAMPFVVENLSLTASQ